MSVIKDDLHQQVPKCDPIRCKEQSPVLLSADTGFDGAQTHNKCQENNCKVRQDKKREINLLMVLICTKNIYSE